MLTCCSALRAAFSSVSPGRAAQLSPGVQPALQHVWQSSSSVSDSLPKTSIYSCCRAASARPILYSSPTCAVISAQGLMPAQGPGRSALRAKGTFFIYKALQVKAPLTCRALCQQLVQAAAALPVTSAAASRD